MKTYLIPLTAAAAGVPLLMLEGCSKDGDKCPKVDLKEFGLDNKTKDCAGMTVAAATDPSDKFWNSTAGEKCGECAVEAAPKAFEAFNVTPNDHCFTTPLCAWGARHIVPTMLETDIQVIYYMADVVTCMNEPNSDDMCRTWYKCADNAQGAACGIPQKSLDASRNKYSPAKFEPCKDVKANDMIKPTKWQDFQCDSCVLINAGNFLIEQVSSPVCAGLKNQKQCQWGQKIPTWAQIADCFKQGDEACQEALSGVSDAVRTQCAFSKDQQKAVDMALTKLNKYPRQEASDQEASGKGHSKGSMSHSHAHSGHGNHMDKQTTQDPSAS